LLQRFSITIPIPIAKDLFGSSFRSSLEKGETFAKFSYAGQTYWSCLQSGLHVLFLSREKGSLPRQAATRGLAHVGEHSGAVYPPVTSHPSRGRLFILHGRGAKPTLMGIDFFRKAVGLQRKHAHGKKNRERNPDQRDPARR